VIFKQQKISEFQSNFINNLAHEFKTPISTIGISAEVLKEPTIINEPERLQQYAKIIYSENNRLHNQVDKILEIAKIENNHLALTREIFNAEYELEKILIPFSIKVNEKMGTIHKNFTAESIWINADKVHFLNSINTVLDNALKYSGDVVNISIATEYLDYHLSIIIQDKGIGIPKEYHKKVFDKFFRVPTGNIHNVKGFGLGLNYVQMIIKAHKWKCDFTSNLGAGTTFTFIIPATKKIDYGSEKN
jgi:two-component system phosphate regulon sensor histidine kinase PhoR